METTATAAATLTLDGRPVPIAGQRNLLELIRAAGIDLPTFCYHSELSVHGACRLCIVEIEGRGVQASCSIVPEPGMVVRTHTPQLRRLRRTTLELLLANHDGDCPTCDKNRACRLQDLARRLGLEQVRFRRTASRKPIDTAAPSLHRDPNKCVLCGDCVRACNEIQGIGVLDFAFRGERTVVQPAFGKPLDAVDCVHCGQCSRVCPTGALTPANHTEAAWALLGDRTRTVVAQIAPAVRAAIGEEFHLLDDGQAFGRIVAALRRLGFAAVYDTAFTADLTVWEEAAEFVDRLKAGERLPLFTSCCPAWVKWLEQSRPRQLDQLSTCRSPQQMFGSLAKAVLPARFNVVADRLAVISIMPCTAKKFEATRPEFATAAGPDVDLVLTTQELASLIRAGGLDPAALAPEAPDQPFGLATGAGVLFGNSGGVGEAVLRYADAVLGDGRLREHAFTAVPGLAGVRAAATTAGDHTIRLAAVSGLANAQALLAAMDAGRVAFDLVEVMACPGGCVCGAGQPVQHDQAARAGRTQILAEADRRQPLRNPADNPAVRCLYDDHLGEVGGEQAHHLLHTRYAPRRRLDGVEMEFSPHADRPRLPVTVCLGTACHLRGSQALLQGLGEALGREGLAGEVDLRATFCLQRCASGPNAKVGDRIVHAADLATLLTAIHEARAGAVAVR